MSRIQYRINEIGLMGALSHNLARYLSGVSDAYTPAEFRFEVERIMRQSDVPAPIRKNWLATMEVMAQDEIAFFKNNGIFKDSNGGTAIRVEELLPPLLARFGYIYKEEEANELSNYVLS